MHQVIETTVEEKFKTYSKLSKKELIGMLIEANTHLNNRPITYKFDEPVIYNTKCFYMSGNDTSGRCINCGKNKSVHP